MIRLCGIILGVALAWTASAADRKNPVEKLASDAAVAYRGGDYVRAVELLERAWKIQPVSALLYNLAKAYEKLGELEKAQDLYQRYAAADDAEPRLRAKAEARVAALREPATRKADPERGRAEPQPPAPPPPPREARAAPPPATTTTVDPRAAKRQAAERGQRRDRGVALGLALTGLGALGAGIGLSVNALMLHDDFSQNRGEDEKRALRDDAKTQALIADVLYGASAVIVGVAIYFTYRGFRPLGHEVAVVPWLSGQGGGLAAGGRF